MICDYNGKAKNISAVGRYYNLISNKTQLFHVKQTKYLKEGKRLFLLLYHISQPV
jgi:hypothetical protein